MSTTPEKTDRGSKKKSGPKPTFEYINHTKSRKNDTVVELEERLMDGPRGVSFKFFSRKGDVINKYQGREKKDGDFDVIQRIDGNSEKTVMTLKELTELFKKVKTLAFVADYMKKNKKIK